MKMYAEPGEKTRFDVYLAAETDYTRSYIKQLIDGGRATLNGRKVKCGAIVKSGDEIELDPPEPVTAAEPRDIPIDIIYEDGDIAVVNKQQ